MKLACSKGVNIKYEETSNINSNTRDSIKRAIEGTQTQLNNMHGAMFPPRGIQYSTCALSSLQTGDGDGKNTEIYHTKFVTMVEQLCVRYAL